MAAARSPPALDPANRNSCVRVQRTFGCVVVDLELSIIDVACECERTPARERVADHSRGIGLARELRERGFEPCAHAVDERPGSGLADGLPDLRCAATDLSFDGVEFADSAYGFRRGWRLGGGVDLAPCMGPACVRISLGKGEVM